MNRTSQICYSYWNSYSAAFHIQVQQIDFIVANKKLNGTVGGHLVYEYDAGRHQVMIG